MSTHGKGIIERLHPDTPLRNNSNGGNKFIHNTIGEYLDNYVRRDLKKQLFLLHATGKYLDIHGEEREVKRNPDESDDAYRERILLEKHMHNTIPELKARGVRFWDYVSGLGSGSQSFYFQLFDTDEPNPIQNMKLQLAVTDLVTNEEKYYNFVTDKRGLAVVNITQPKHSYKLVLKTIDSSDTYEDLTLDFSMNNKYSSKNNTMLLANTQNIKRYNNLGFKLFADNGTILKNKDLKITVNGITYTKTTNNEGIAYLNIRLLEKDYLVNYCFEGDDYYNPCEGTLHMTVSSQGSSLKSITLDSGIVYDVTGTELTSQNTYIKKSYLAHAILPVQEHMLDKFIIDGVLEWF